MKKAYESDETMIVLHAVVGILMSACQLKSLPGFRKLHNEIFKRPPHTAHERAFFLFQSPRRALYVFVHCPYMTTCTYIYIYICLLTSFRYGQLHKQLQLISPTSRILSVINGIIAIEH